MLYVTHLTNLWGCNLQGIIVNLLLALVTKLLNEQFLAKFLVETLRVWSKTTETKWDDNVTEAIAEVYNIPKESLEAK